MHNEGANTAADAVTDAAGRPVAPSRQADAERIAEDWAEFWGAGNAGVPLVWPKTLAPSCPS